MHIYQWQTDPPNEHRSMQHHYTQSVSDIEECIYTHMDPLATIDHWNTTTLHHFNLVLRNMESCIKKYGYSTVQVQYCFPVSHLDIPPLSFCLALLLCHWPPSNQPYISGTPLHHISVTDRRMHICT